MPSAMSSAQKAWKMGHATSGSRAPSSQRREREMLDCIGMGRECVSEISMSASMGLALLILESKVAVYVGWVYSVGLVFGRGA